MTVNDPIADMLTRVRNAVMVRHDSVLVPSSKMKLAIANILKEEGFISDYEVVRGKSRRDIKILLTHYAPTYKTLKGENNRIYGNLGSQKMEQVLTNSNVTFAVHGHVHYGIPLAFVESIPVFNVSFLINKDIVLIDTENLPKAGLHNFAEK